MKVPAFLAGLLVAHAAELRGAPPKAPAFDTVGSSESSATPPVPPPDAQNGPDDSGSDAVAPPHKSMDPAALAHTKTTSASDFASMATKPNILMVLVDDQGHGDIDLGNEHDEFHTPAV